MKPPHSGKRVRLIDAAGELVTEGYLVLSTEERYPHESGLVILGEGDPDGMMVLIGDHFEVVE